MIYQNKIRITTLLTLVREFTEITALLNCKSIRLGMVLRRAAIGGTRSSLKELNTDSTEKQQTLSKGGVLQPSLNTTCSNF